VLREIAPHVKAYAAEIETAAPLSASLAAGAPETVNYTSSFVDGIGSRVVFANMLERARPLIAGSIVVTLADAARAMKLAAERNRVIIEGASACAVAAAMSGRAGNGRVAAIVSGGNIDLDKFAQLTAQA
jgi:threonine dehydratase